MRLLPGLLLLATAGCGPLKACGGASTPPVTPAPSASAPSQAPRVPESAPAPAQPEPSRPSGPVTPRLVTARGERLFLLLTHEPQPQPGVTLHQVGGDRTFWMASLEKEPTGALSVGQGFDLYDEHGPVRAGCKVKGFALLNRGIPPFEYLESATPPTQPGCGQPWPVAELECPAGGAPMPDEEATNGDAQHTYFALPAGSPAPRYLSAHPLPEQARKEQEAVLRAMPLFATLSREGREHARNQGAPFKQSFDVRAYDVGLRTLVVAVARFLTGTGEERCTDYYGTVSRVVARGADGQESLRGPKDMDGDSIIAVLDLEGDGEVELLTRDPREPLNEGLVSEWGQALFSSFVDVCGSSC